MVRKNPDDLAEVPTDRVNLFVNAHVFQQLYVKIYPDNCSRFRHLPLKAREAAPLPPMRPSRRLCTVAVQGGGDIVVTRAGPTPSANGGFARRISRLGTLLGNEIIVGDAGRAFMPRGRITAMDNGNVAVAGEFSEQLTQPGPFRVAVQRLRQRGPLWGDPVMMEQVMAGTSAKSGQQRRFIPDPIDQTPGPNT